VNLTGWSQGLSVTVDGTGVRLWPEQPRSGLSCIAAVDLA